MVSQLVWKTSVSIRPSGRLFQLLSQIFERKLYKNLRSMSDLRLSIFLRKVGDSATCCLIFLFAIWFLNFPLWYFINYFLLAVFLILKRQHLNFVGNIFRATEQFWICMGLRVIKSGFIYNANCKHFILLC